MAERKLSERNAKIAAMLESGDRLKDFYRFLAQNSHISLHDACQIVAERTEATVCYTLDEWNTMGRRVTKGRKSISYYDHDGYKQFVFDLSDTHGEVYRRDIFPLKHLLIGLDELNGTNAYADGRSDQRKIHSGVYVYLEKQGELTGDEQYDRLLTEGIAYSLYCRTGFPKTAGIRLHGLPYPYRDNAEFVKEVYIRSEFLAQDIEEAYGNKLSQIRIIDDIEEETVSDEPVLSAEQAEDGAPGQGVRTSEKTRLSEQESAQIVPEQGAANPLYRRYLDAQRQNPQAIVLIRVGDFWEALGENARTVAEELGLTLTSRDVGLPERIPMCGFPYFAAEAYLEKIREKHGVILAEDGKEPVYVLSRAEALEQRAAAGNAETDGKSAAQPVLEEIDDEPNPFDGEQSEGDAGLAEEEHAEPEPEQGEAEAALTPKRDEKGIQDRKRKQKPQLSMFELLEPKSDREQLIERQLLYGSGVEYGKFRIYDKYRTNPTAKEFADFLKREYGIGGHSGTDEEWHDGKGIRFSHDGANGKIEAFLKWQDVALRIADLIDDGAYFSEQEKAQYAAYRQTSGDGLAQRLEKIAREMVESGTRNTTDSSWVTYFEEFGEEESFVRAHAGELVEKLNAREEVAAVELLEEGFDLTFYLDFCSNHEDVWGEFAAEEAKEKVKVGDKFRYQNREWTVKGFDGLYPDQVVITCTEQTGNFGYDVTLNIDVKELLEKGERTRPERGENADLASILDQTDLGGAKTRFKNNVEAIRLVNFLDARNAAASDAEKKTLSQFVGWGGLAQAFDEKNESWKKEYAELKTLLSAEDYEQARSSTLNAYYTPKEVIGGIYAALERFGVKGNNRILEPAMGTGNFFGYMPKEIAEGSRLYGVELDSITGRIAAKLYPQANVQIKGFEDTSFPNDKFDIVVGNVPFGGYGVADSEYNRYNFKVHDYFLAKSVDKVRPGGIVAVITSKGSLDKRNPSARRYITERTELLGAVRLPNNAFKQTAGTEAVADILFFRKREEKITDLSHEEWLGTGKTAEGYEINNYFLAHPEMILGTLAEEHGLYGGIDTTVKPDGRELKDALAEAIDRLPQNVYIGSKTPPEQEREAEPDYNVKPFCYKAERGKLYQRVGDEMAEQAIPKTPKDAYPRICGMIALRESLHHILDIQIQGCSDEVLQSEQQKLNAQYDVFVKKYGSLNSQTNSKLFKDDGDSALLFACENVNEETKAVTKADVFFKRTIRPYIVSTSTDDPFEALQISKNERGKVDIAYIEELTGKSYDTVLSELGNAVFRDPERVEEGDRYSGFVTNEEYLSGQVVTKLEQVRALAAEHPKYQKNVTALEAVQPEPLSASEISVRLGATWVDKAYYKQFYCELVGVYWYQRDSVELTYNPHDSSWRLDQKDSVRGNTKMRQTEVYGTKRAPAYRLFIDAMNLKATTIYDTIEEDGKEKRVVNHAETIAAREKQNKIKEAFAEWIFKAPERREELEATYNRLFNRTRLPSYDGSYLKFPEMNPAIELKPHQKNAVHRIITGDSSTLLHHVVGAGKTFTVIASIMKMRQLGLCKKAMVTVPNHLVQQWAGEWRKLYPNAHILVATKEDLEKDNRKKFVSKVALGDWDGIIIAQSSFGKIPISQERQIKKLKEEIESVEATIQKQWEESGMPRGAVKSLEVVKKNKQKQLKKLMDGSGKDDVLKFEDLGVDYLFVDEAQNFKNLFLFSKMNNVAGISNAASQRASDLKLKCEYLQELHGSDRGVVFATGTPISNSMTEMYTMQTYLQPSVLRELGITFFDGWAADFGETITSMELSPSGQGYRARTRFAKFTNLPELLKLYRSFADVQTADMVKLNVPEAERHVVNLKPSDTVIELAEEIAERADKIYGGGVDSHIDNMLKVTSDGKKLALDPRCYVSTSEDGAGSKLNACAQNIFEIWEDTQDIKGTQIVFCDLSTPKVRFEDYTYGTDFDAYNDLKYKLVQTGIPAQEIAFIHEANTDEQKQALFDKVNAGAVRVLIGSTEKCGAGTNVQKRLVALHHLDTPYRPSDMEQREGRIIRQGNTNAKVQIFTYVMERTFDSYSYQILENKQRFISQINRGDLTVREAEDIDETTLSYAEIKAITAANPKIKRKMEVDAEVARLRVLEGQYRKNLYDLQDKIRKYYPEEIRKQELLIERVGKDMEMLKTARPAAPETFSIRVNGKVYTDKKEGGRALTDALYAGKVNVPVAEYCGFKIGMNPMSFLSTEREITLAAEGQYTISVGESASGNLTRIENFLNDLPDREARLKKRLEQLRADLAVAEEQAGKPFEQAERLKKLLSEQAQLNAELNLNQREEAIVDDDGEEEENYRALPENWEENRIDEEDKVAAMRADVLPDYSVTQGDMHAYGYMWDGMLPMNGTAAKALAKTGLTIYELRPNDTEGIVDGAAAFDEKDRLFGVEKPAWNTFVSSEKGRAYIAARLEIVRSVFASLNGEEMRDFSNTELEILWEQYGTELPALEKALGERGLPSVADMEGYVLSVFAEQEEKLKAALPFFEHGWSEADIAAAIYGNIGDEELKRLIAGHVQSGSEQADDFLDDETKENKEDELAESKYLKETARGYRVVSIAQDKNGRNVAVVQRNNDFTVAIGYDTSDGKWAQGVYDFKDERAANDYREKYYGKDVEPPERWYEVFVSKEALIKAYQKSSLMRMPSSNREYADYTYFIFNNRIKEGRQLTDAMSDSRELCYKILLSEGETVLLRNRDGDEAELSAQEFSELVNHTSDKDYAREEKPRLAVHIPREAMLKSYGNSSLYRAPQGTEFAEYVYYLPNSVVSENKEAEDGSMTARLSEDFKVTLRNGEEKIELNAQAFADLVGGTRAEDYKRERKLLPKTEADGEEKQWLEIAVNENAVIANYEKSTLFKTPAGKYEGMVYYIPSGMVRKDENGIRLRLPEDFAVHLKDKGANVNIDITPEELAAELAGKGSEAYENIYRRPSEEARRKFEKVEKNLRASLPDEMKNKPNWVVVRTRENKETGRLEKFLIDVHTGKFAESNDPKTWTDFETACSYAKEHGGTALGFALDGTDGIACIDLDGCIDESGKRSALADEVLAKCGETYVERSVSGRGIHVFGKTRGADLRSFSKDGDMEYYQGRHFITMTGDGASCAELASLDTPEMQSLLERKLERRTPWKNAGKGEAGLTQMDDRELLEKAFAAKNGDTVRRLYNGEDLRHNRSNSDMSLMNYLAFYSGGNIEQMVRIFATSGLYRPDKPASYYEYTAIKAAKDTPHYTPPKPNSSAPKINGGGNGKA